MEAKELMIGDWVDIQEEGKHLKFTKVHSLTASYDEPYYFPIPLTPEILKANMFNIEEDGAYTYYDGVHIPEQQYIAVLFRRNKTARHIEIKRIRCHVNYDEIIYVHQFQQALRLCGLNDFADNFKLN